MEKTQARPLKLNLIDFLQISLFNTYIFTTKQKEPEECCHLEKIVEKRGWSDPGSRNKIRKVS